MNQQEALCRIFFISLIWVQWRCDRENDRLSRQGVKGVNWRQNAKSFRNDGLGKKNPNRKKSRRSRWNSKRYNVNR